AAGDICQSQIAGSVDGWTCIARVSIRIIITVLIFEPKVCSEFEGRRKTAYVEWDGGINYARDFRIGTAIAINFYTAELIKVGIVRIGITRGALQVNGRLVSRTQ